MTAAEYDGFARIFSFGFIMCGGIIQVADQTRRAGMQMKMKVILLVTGFFAVVFASMANAADFSADMINTAGGKVFKGKIYMGNNKTRMETQESISITRMDKKVVWILMPKDKMYMEQVFDPSRAPVTSEKVEGEVERKLIGQEVIDGKKADKYKVVYTDKRKKESMFQWISPGIAMPVKMAAVDNSWSTEYKNIKTGKQSDALFEIPAGYQKFSMGMPSMKDMFKKGLGQ
jgi:hypothetical protein